MTYKTQVCKKKWLFMFFFIFFSIKRKKKKIWNNEYVYIYIYIHIYILYASSLVLDLKYYTSYHSRRVCMLIQWLKNRDLKILNRTLLLRFLRITATFVLHQAVISLIALCQEKPTKK